jgi:hypothetical protein
MRSSWLVIMALIMLIPLTSAEYVTGGGFNVSFELGTTHDVVRDQEQTGNLSFTIETLDGSAKIALDKSKKLVKSPAELLKEFFFEQ